MSELRHVIHQPGRELRGHVREMLWIESAATRTQILLPETGFVLAFRRSGGVTWQDRTLPLAVLSGLQPRARRMEHGSNSSLMVVRFTETGAAALLRDDAGSFYGQTLALDAVLPRQWIEDVQNALADAADASTQFRVVERHLIERMRGSREIPQPIEAAARIIRTSGGKVVIASVARHVGMSQSVLERRMNTCVGTSPKRLARLARLHNVCRLWNAGFDLTRIAQEAGYSDQPHLVHDFRLFTGLAPLEYFRSSSARNLPNFYKE